MVRCGTLCAVKSTGIREPCSEQAFDHPLRSFSAKASISSG